MISNRSILAIGVSSRPHHPPGVPVVKRAVARRPTKRDAALRQQEEDVMKVPQIRFGRTGLTIPRITLGAGWVGGIVIRGDEAERRAVLDGAVEAGVDWIDTAALYGDGVSEQMIGAWLRGRSSRPRLSTKFTVDLGAPDLAGQMMRSVEASLARLGLEKVEAILLHNTVIADPAARRSGREIAASEVLAAGGMADAMERLRREGLCDWLGFTALGEPSGAAAVIDSGRFDVAQVYYNMLNPTADAPAPPGWNSTDFIGLLHKCRAGDMGVMGIRIFAAGHLGTDERHGREIPLTANSEAKAEEARATAAFAALTDASGSAAQRALRFGLACDLLSTIVIGVGEVWHLAHALEALALGPLAEAELQALTELRNRHPAFVGPAPA
jgi:aryl-alcohol dehydrogenase-like predicted oxidoreductase